MIVTMICVGVFTLLAIVLGGLMLLAVFLLRGKLGKRDV